MELIDWVEEQAKENLQSRNDNLEKLITDANSFLKISLAGISAISIYLLKIYTSANPQQWLIYSLIVVMVYLIILAALIIKKCLKVGDSYPTTNEPKNLYLPDFELTKIRETQLKNTQSNIDFMVQRNAKIATALDQAKSAILVTPLIFIMCALAVYHL